MGNCSDDPDALWSGPSQWLRRSRLLAFRTTKKSGKEQRDHRQYPRIGAHDSDSLVHRFALGGWVSDALWWPSDTLTS